MKKILSILLLAAMMVSCDSFLDIKPTGKVIAESAEEYRALLTSVYSNFPDDRSLTTLRTDEMVLDSVNTTAEDLNSYFDIWTWQDVAQDENTSSFNWRTFYHAIYIANYVIEHKDEITGGTAAVVNQMVGESYMLRAYCHFILVNLYGEPYTKCNPDTAFAVPLVVEADVDAVSTRNSVSEIYTQILSDIMMARSLLNVKEWEPMLRYRFNTVSADAFLARVDLYMGDWNGALEASKAVIEAHPNLQNIAVNADTLPDKYYSQEAIVSLEQVMKSAYRGIGPVNPDFASQMSNDDVRKEKYFDHTTDFDVSSGSFVIVEKFSLKKGGAKECRSTFRSAEAYLTAAEAAVRLGNLTDAISYITPLINTRYKSSAASKLLAKMSGMTQDELLTAVLHERTYELCFEGHRWFDLRRTTQPVITKTFGGTTYTLQQGDNRYTMPIPTEALSANPNLK